jgi:carboxyl-terminal processing protease
LPWDEIGKATYNNWSAGYDLKTIQQLSNQRMENDVTFKTIRESTDWLSKQNDKEYSLQIDKYRKEQSMIRTTVKQLESLSKLTGELDVSALPNETNRWENDKNKQERFNQWIKVCRKTFILTRQ